jgi:DHA1 family multidrug resistance protein B-like MFS transporter
MRFRDFHPNVRLRIVMNFFVNTLSNMVTPFMAVYFAKTLGNTAAGLTTIVSIAVGLVFATLGGYYADRIGRKKMMLIAEAVCTGAYASMALANSPWFHSAYVTLAMTILNSAGWGLSKPAMEAMLIDVTQPDARKFMYRITYWTNNLSLSVAGIAGAFLFGSYLFELFLAVAFLTMLSFTVTAIFIAETLQKTNAVPEAGQRFGQRSGQEKKLSFFDNYKQVFRDKTFMVYIAASVLLLSVEQNLTNYIGVRLGEQMPETEWLPWLHAKINGLHMLGILRTENTLAVVVLSLFIGALVKGKSDTRTLFAGLALNVLGYGYLAMGNQPALLLLMMLIGTVGELMYVPVKQAYLVNIVPNHARSSYMAINGMVHRTGQILCGLNVIIGGFVPGWGMACLIALTGAVGMLMLYTIVPKLEAGTSRTTFEQTNAV